MEGYETLFKIELFGLFWSGGGAFLCGEGVFLFCSDGGVFLGGDFDDTLSSGGGPFFWEGDFVFFFDVGGSPLVGGNRAFMAEPSDRPAINDGVDGREKKGGVDMKKGEEIKKKRGVTEKRT